MHDFNHIVQAAKKAQIRFTDHGAQQAFDRNILTIDILNAIINYQKIIYKKKEDKYNIYGQYSKTHLLHVSCVYQDGILIITTHKISKKRVK